MFSGLWRAKRNPPGEKAGFPVVVDPNDDFETMARIGGYEIGQSLFRSHDSDETFFPFPLHRGPMYAVECEQVQLVDSIADPGIPYYATLDRLKEKRYRPATPHEFLCFLAQHPRNTRVRRNICCVGEALVDDLNRLTTLMIVNKRDSYVLMAVQSHAVMYHWTAHHLFLAVSKSSEAVTIID